MVDVNKKRERISTYLQRIEHVTSSERGADLLQSMVERDFVLNIDDPALVDRVAVSLYESEKQLAVNRGLERDIQQLEGNEELLEQYRQLVYEKHTQQRHTLAPWLEYVRANDADYPTWFRYYVVRGLKGMGAFNRESKSYARRSEDTVAPFPELNAEAV